ncbi:hypothetical protein [Paenibacillus sp. FSL K6-2524]|uniref:hypothetical protein n=1 Tax=Paenibacillus sp. FSL K6-2524 TaxID=2954516 RepID=UPI0030F8F5E1
MEYILQDIDIFDTTLADKLNNAMMTTMDAFEQGNEYNLTVSFHESLLDDYSRIYMLNIPDIDAKNNNTMEDKIHNLLSFQIQKIENIITQNGINLMAVGIQGETLEVLNMIKIQINKVESEPKKSKKNPLKVTMIIPSLTYLDDLAETAIEIILNECVIPQIVLESLGKGNDVNRKSHGESN